MTELIDQFEQALLSADRVAARDLFFQSAKRTTPIGVIDNIIVPVLENIGRDWEKGNVSLSQVYMSARISEELSESVTPSSGLQETNCPQIAVALLEDYHFLGKKIVCSVLRASGISFIDYSRVSVKQLVKYIKKDKIEILLVSVLMLHSALKIKELKKELQKQNIITKIIAGGAPFRLDDQLWQEVGADAMGKSASEAVRLVLNLIEE